MAALSARLLTKRQNLVFVPSNT